MGIHMMTPLFEVFFKQRVVTSVTVYARVRKSAGTGYAYAWTKLRIGGAEYDGNLVDITAWTNYDYISTTYTTNPLTGLPWAEADIATLSCGVYVQGSSLFDVLINCTQIYLEVQYVPELVTMRPAGDINTMYWNLFGDTPHWKCVDEVVADEDLTYIQEMDRGLGLNFATYICSLA